MSTDKSVAVGVELAGKGTTVALIDRRGRVRHRLHARTLMGRPAIATIEPTVRSIESVLAYALSEGFKVRGVGISLPGTLDNDGRRPLQIPTLSALNDFPLCDYLEARYNLPVKLRVDVDAALLGEHRFGAGKGVSRLLFLTVNAVVGASLVVDGQLEQSAQQYVGHIGHISHMHVTTNGPRCSCGKRGCINTLVSIDAMQKMVQRALRRGEQTSLTQRLLNRECFTPQLLAEEAERGDSVALHVYSEVGRWLGLATTRYIDVFEPHKLILAGESLSSSDLLLKHVRQALMTRSSSNVCTMVDVVPARLGSDASLIGSVVPLF
ncbi:MAG TPA: ROK family protein [Ktedonobacteraceae bacterium]